MDGEQVHEVITIAHTIVMRRVVQLRRVGVGFDMGQGVFSSVAKMINKHRSGTLESVDLGSSVNRVSVGAVRDSIHQVASTVLVKLLVSKVEILHLLGHHLGSL